MGRKALPYREGDWIAVPLKDGIGYAIGLVARSDGKGTILGYFFGRLYDHVPETHEIPDRSPADAILVGLLGDLGVIEKRWCVLGPDGRFTREKWPIPVFGRVDFSSDRAWQVVYSEDNLHHPVSEVPVDKVTANGLPKDALMGAGAVEKRLTRLLLTVVN